MNSTEQGAVSALTSNAGTTPPGREFRDPPTWFSRFIVGIAAWAIVTAAPITAQETAVEGFSLREVLGQSWSHERATFSLTPAQLEKAKAAKSLAEADGSTITFQWSDGGDAEPQIDLQTDLKPFETRTFHFSQTHPTVPTDLKIEETADRIRLTNSLVGISVLKVLEGEYGPIDEIRLASGRWIGGSKLKTTQTITSYRAKLISHGPVFAEIVCMATFADDAVWQMRLRILANEPVILVDETTGGLNDDCMFILTFGQGFTPNRIFYRHGAGDVGRNADEPIGTDSRDPVFVLEPWLHWWERQRQGIWCGVYDEAGQDFLSLAAREPALWIDPQKPRDAAHPARVLVAQQKGDLVAQFPLREGARRWMLAALDKHECLSILKETVAAGPRGPVTVKRTPIPQQLVVKHSDLPLNLVKDLLLDWPGNDRLPARLFVGKDDLQRFRSRFVPNPVLLANYRARKFENYELDGPVSYYLGTGDAVLGKRLGDQAVSAVQAEVDRFFRQDQYPTLGALPHHRANNLLPAVNLASLMFDSEHVAPDLQRRMRAQLAFLAYTVNRPDFYSPARGYSANPNMTSTVSAFQVLTAGAIPSHPLAGVWIDGGLNELKKELEQWPDENGGWLEAPHYAIVAYDVLIACFLAAHHAGQSEVLFDPKMQRVGDWLAKISTPRDWQAGGYRHLPPIGNTYLQEASGVFGLLAYLWRTRDPEFAARMQWMHREQGEFKSPGIGGFYPALAGFRTVLLDPDGPEQAPQWKSELFPRTGAVLRNGFPSGRETQLLLIAGRNHDHYDDDSGSFTLWGKGRLLASDFGYSGFPSAADHNLVIPQTAGPGIMNVREFTTTAAMDFVTGVRGGWTRQIAFIKDADPLGPNYFVLNDVVSGPAPARWQLWLTAAGATTKPGGAEVHGIDDVDLDITFMTPNRPEITTESKTRTCAGLLANGQTNSQMQATQTGLIATFTDSSLMTVLYPRLFSELQPVVTSFAEGRGVKVVIGSRTDYVFLSPVNFRYSENGLTFEGTAGLIASSPGHIRLALGSPGRIALGDRQLAGEVATTKVWKD